MNELLEELKKDLQEEESRYAYADTVTNAFVSAQIKALREERGLSQQELAGLAGTKQSGISRLEKSEYSAWKVETLRKLAKALGVRLRIRFEGFGSLVDEIKGFNEENLVPKRFEQDPVLFPIATKRRRKVYSKKHSSTQPWGNLAPRKSPARSGTPYPPSNPASPQGIDRSINNNNSNAGLPSGNLPPIAHQSTAGGHNAVGQR